MGERPEIVRINLGPTNKRYALDRDFSSPGPGGSSSTPRLVPRRGMEASDASDDEADGQGWSISYKRKQVFGIAALIGSPPILQAEQPDRDAGETERRRMRDHYEREGWLPAPSPGHRLSKRRKRMMQVILKSS